METLKCKMGECRVCPVIGDPNYDRKMDNRTAILLCVRHILYQGHVLV